MLPPFQNEVSIAGMVFINIPLRNSPRKILNEILQSFFRCCPVTVTGPLPYRYRLEAILNVYQRDRMKNDCLQKVTGW